MVLGTDQLELPQANSDVPRVKEGLLSIIANH
jgi:hypothetical protein